MLKAVLFDFDGTLADTLPAIFHTFRESFRTYLGQEPTDQEILSRFGPPEEEILCREIDDIHVEEAMEHFYRLYRDQHSGLVRSHPPIIQLLQWLKQMDIPVGIVTGKGRRSAKISLELLGMEDLYDSLITGTEVNRYKPDPEGIIIAMEELGCPPGQGVYIGDSDVDIRAGKAAGLLTVGVSWFHQDQNHRFQPAPDQVCHEVSDLHDWLRLQLDSAQKNQ